MQKTLNLKVKYRESFRPFAPSVLREDVADWFELDCGQPVHAAGRRRARSSAAATMTARSRALFGIDKLNVPRSEIPAVTHVDYSARVQTVHARDQSALPRADLARSSSAPAARCSSTPASTCAASRSSCTPEDAFRCFMGTEIEVLVVGNCLLRKEDQDPALKLDYKDAFELD